MNATVARGTIGTAGTPGTPRLHLTRRGRVVFTTLAGVPLVIGAVAFALNGGVAVAEGASSGAGHIDTVHFDYVTIQSGQSLWQLAETVAPTADPRQVIADIKSLNRLSADAVQPGQRLAIPADY